MGIILQENKLTFTQRSYIYLNFIEETTLNDCCLLAKLFVDLFCGFCHLAKIPQVEWKKKSSAT